MDRFRTVALLLIVVLVCGGLWGVAAQGSEEAETLCIPMGHIVLSAPDGVEAKRSAVDFPHNLHFGYNCKTCHHKWENDTDLNGCMACHDLTESPSKAGGGKVDPEEAVMYYKTAYHKMCIGCHKEIKQKSAALAKSGRVLKDKLPPTGPTGCAGCHPKE